jgi:hypothetical protein
MLLSEAAATADAAPRTMFAGTRFETADMVIPYDYSNFINYPVEFFCV